ncbi:hypothetical protein G6F31_016440 [Rhizopus arrhizus]|nr:hypothetical protein G6F31_016440 [Rhizopus arrhizus]
MGRSRAGDPPRRRRVDSSWRQALAWSRADAPLVLGELGRGERAVTVAGTLHAHRAMLGLHRLAAGAVALVGLASGLSPRFGTMPRTQNHG